MTRVIVMLPCADIDEVADRLFRETVPEPAPSPMPPPHERILDAEFLAELDERLRPERSDSSGLRWRDETDGAPPRHEETTSMTTAPRDRRGVVLLSLLAIAALLLAGCGAAPKTQREGDGGLLAAYGLEGLDAREVIERLDTMAVAGRPTDLMASVRPDALVLSDPSGREERLAMPRDEVYVAVAPYREQTHECHFHSLTTCLGELRGEDVAVRLTDADGTLLLDEKRRTYDNGFVGLWVPRGLRASLTIEHGDRRSTTRISTRSADDATCVTTMQLT